MEVVGCGLLGCFDRVLCIGEVFNADGSCVVGEQVVCGGGGGVVAVSEGG